MSTPTTSTGPVSTGPVGTGPVSTRLVGTRPVSARSVSTRLVPAVLLVLGFAVVGLAAAGAAAASWSDVREVLTPLWLVLGPGWAIAAALRPASPAACAVLAVACGLAVSIVVGQAMVVSGAWHPVAVLFVLAAVAQPVLVVHTMRRGPV